MEKQTASRTSPNICHVNAPKKEKACGGGELPGTSGEMYWALMKKRQSREKKVLSCGGTKTRESRAQGRETDCLSRPNLFSRCPAHYVNTERDYEKGYQTALPQGCKADQAGASPVTAVAIGNGSAALVGLRRAMCGFVFKYC